MDDPEIVLRDTILKNNWTLTSALAKDKIVFGRIDWRLEEGLHDPRIIVRHRNTVRQQEVDELFDYFAEAEIVIWCTDTGAIETGKANKWKMMEEIKRIIGSASVPSGWRDMKVMSCVNRDVEGVLPSVLIETVTIRLTLYWSPT